MRIALRRRYPDTETRFRVPFHPVTLVLGVACCLYLMLGTGRATWLQFSVFLLAGGVLYALYGRRNSRLAAGPPKAGTEPKPLVDAWPRVFRSDQADPGSVNQTALPRAVGR
ncbi:hypothetical protein GCM10010271_40440 [Streptomyces kurssanovii]|nr:hypothetical protein GCM10010271_40440 [Streptomyces kurssanovii]